MTSREKKTQDYNFPYYVILTAVLVFLSFAPWLYGLTQFRNQLIAEIFIHVIFLLSLFFIKLKPGMRMNLRQVDTWIVFAIACVLINAATITVVPEQSLYSASLFVSLAIFYFLLRSILINDRTFQVLIWGVFAIGSLYSAYGLLQIYAGFPHSFWYSPQSLASRYVNGGHFAAYLIFSLFIGIHLFTWTSSRAMRFFVLILIAIQSWAFVLTRSRTVWIAFFLGCLFLFFYYRKQGVLNKLRFSGFTGIVAGVVLSLILYKGFYVIKDRFEEVWNIKDAQFYTLTYRLQLWEGCIKAIWNRPLGWGAGTLSSIFPLFRVNDDRFFVDYAHNEILHTGVDFGFPGIIYLLSFIVFYLYQVNVILKNDQMTTEIKSMASIFAAIWVSLLISCQTDFPLRIFSNALFFVVFLALSAYLFDRLSESNSSDAENTVVKMKLFARSKFVFFAVVSVLLMTTARQLAAEVVYERGGLSEKNFEWDKTIVLYQRAIDLGFVKARYYQALADIYKKKMGLSFDAEKKREFRAKSIHAYNEAAMRNPFIASNYYYLGILYEDEGQLERAEGLFSKAIQTDPNNSFFVLEYGYFALRHGKKEEAINTFEKYKLFKFREGVYLCDILKKMSKLTTSYDDLRRVVLDDWEGHRCLGMFLAEQGEWGLAKSEFDRCLKQALAVFDYPVFWRSVAAPIAEIYIKNGRYEDALTIYRDAATADPQNKEVRVKLDELSKMGTGAPADN